MNLFKFSYLSTTKHQQSIKMLKNLSLKDYSILNNNLTNKLNNNKISSIMNIQKKHYHPVRELMKRNTTTYYQDPAQVGEELLRLICLHDKIKDPTKVTLGSTFEEMGLDSLDFVECILEIENYWGYDFGPADWEQFLTINDIAQFICKDYYGERH